MDNFLRGPYNKHSNQVLYIFGRAVLEINRRSKCEDDIEDGCKVIKIHHMTA